MKIMRQTVLWICALLLGTMMACHAGEEDAVGNESRTWTSASGTTIDAAFGKMTAGLVHLKKADGNIVQIKLSSLSAEDRAYVRSRTTAGFGGKAAAKPKAKAPDKVVELFGKELIDSKKKKVSVDELAGKTIGVYFSAHWCPPCRAFTPELVKFYNKLQKDGKPFELVFVSSDKDKAGMYKYMKEMDMPWLALPFGDEHKGSLASQYGVRGIPMLVILDKEGNTITGNGRGEVSAHGADAFDRWQTASGS